MYDELLDAWALPRPRELTRATRGISNETWFVRSEAGDHVLRLYVNKRTEAIRLEHELLRRLASADLTFRTPKPLETEAGDTLAIEVDSARQAALFRRIEGEPLNDEDAAGIAKAAAAFASLDIALAAIERTDVPSPLFTGDLRTVHTAISDLAQIEDIAGRQARHLVDEAAENAAVIYRSLPTQLIHGDFSLGNVLMRAGRVRGVLDFEYAGRTVRAMELGGVLRNVLMKGNGEQLWGPAVQSYMTALPLDPIEVAALPALVLLQSAIVVVWLAGRGLEGHSTAEALGRYVDQGLTLREWITRNGARLVAVALRVID
jgi:Ser/Thr protein kinase RdoA (MazF antagonist)